MLSRIKDALWIDVTEVIAVEADGANSVKLYMKSGEVIRFNDHHCHIATPTRFVRFKHEQEKLMMTGHDVQDDALGVQDTP